MPMECYLQKNAILKNINKHIDMWKFTNIQSFEIQSSKRQNNKCVF